ncbi:MAG: L-glyceraldehyde 3-phosphate reductase [Clostridiales bacterium]|nr:L-glyceraldehyde 3-phosphate reductase [Clostridiales bacterium]
MDMAADTRYDSMKYNRSGKSGLKLPALSLGLWHNFGTVDNYANMADMVTTAFDHGITHFDLANNYGPVRGAAEENFGHMLKNELAGYRDELVISTKAGYYMWPGPYGEWGSRKYLLASLDQSLKRMGVDYVDIFYSHRPDPDTPMEETMGALNSAVRAGKALYVGVSSYSPEQTRQAHAILKSMGTPLTIHQPSYSMLNRWIEDGLTDALDELGVGSIAFCPLQQGLLTDKYLSGIPEGSRAAKAWGFLKARDITEDKLRIVGRLNEFAAGRGQKLSQLALQWALEVGRLTSALIGASKPSQIVENLGALNAPALTIAELIAIDGILKG